MDTCINHSCFPPCGLGHSVGSLGLSSLSHLVILSRFIAVTVPLSLCRISEPRFFLILFILTFYFVYIFIYIDLIEGGYEQIPLFKVETISDKSIFLYLRQADFVDTACLVPKHINKVNTELK